MIETVPVYYMIFHKIDGDFVCIVDRLDVAIDFCHKYKDFYYVRSDELK
jgi:hypothetical protein